jgi:hypothetical protein
MYQKLIIIAMLFGLLFVGLPVPHAKGDTECCCFPTKAMLNKIELFVGCLLDGNPHRLCGQCSALYGGTEYCYGCIVDDECSGMNYIECGQIGFCERDYEMQGEPDTSICDPLEIGCTCPLPAEFIQGPWAITCSEAFCEDLGVDCECP